MSFFNVSGTGLGFLQGLVISGRVKSKLASMAAGRVIAQYATLAPSELGTYAPALADYSGRQISEMLNAMYGVAPIDYKAIRDYAVKFYEVRCRNAHGCCRLSYTGTNGVYNMFHIGEQLSPEELGEIKNNSQLFASLTAGFEEIYKHIDQLCKNNPLDERA